MSLYTPTSVSTAVALPSATLQANFEEWRTVSRQLDEDNFVDITTDKIASPKISLVSDNGIQVYYESGMIDCHSQFSSDLRASAVEGAWTAPASWSYYDNTTQRNVKTSSRPTNGTIDDGPILGSCSTVFFSRPTYVIVTANYHIGPQYQSNPIVDPIANNPEVCFCFLQHTKPDGDLEEWPDLYTKHSPWITLDSYLRGHTIRLAATVEAGWHSFAMIARDQNNKTAYSFVGASTFIVEAYSFQE